MTTKELLARDKELLAAASMREMQQGKWQFNIGNTMDLDNFKAVLPKHRCSLTINHNEHKDCYQSVEEFTSHHEDYWISEDSKARAIATDEIWEVMWFPDNPLAFYSRMAATLEELLMFIKEQEALGKYDN